MEIVIYDVGHGACAVVTSSSGRRMMIDCGSDHDRPWYPSIAFAGREIEILTISNFDEDHVTDFVNLNNKSYINTYMINSSIDARALAAMKAEGGMGKGIQAIHDILADPAIGAPPQAADISPVDYRVYRNHYGTHFTDPNNLSLVTFVEYAGFKVIFPGDLERAGWLRLLEDQQFRNDLVGVDVFVASHHGRASGQCQEVFDIWRPQIIVMSDKDKQFDSQETVPWYNARAQGMIYNNENRSVFTTRRDGDIYLSVQANGNANILTQK